MRLITPLLLSLLTLSAHAQEEATGTPASRNTHIYKVEMQGSFSKGKTPLWLNANKHGLSSLDKTNGYVRASIERPLANDSLRRWGYGYGADVAVPFGYTSNVVVQQAFVEGRWLHGTLTIGSKEYPMNLKNDRLSSGSQTLGINARPVPQVRLALTDYWTVPLTRGWLQLKGHIAYGMLTDDNWQKDFTSAQSRYTSNVLYHSKAGYLRIGRDPYYYPFSVELGLETATLFGGKTHTPGETGEMQTTQWGTGLTNYWHAFIPGGKDATDGANYKNAEGDVLGSWVISLNWETDTWKAGLYADKFFEDHSAMFQLDYDGYGTGDEWQEKKKRRYVLYDFKDWMLGFDLNLKYGSWLRGLVVEYLYTQYQSGPMYHDHTTTIADHIGGVDNYYNHSNYAGWQHWGQVMGNPLYRSPLYNTDGSIDVQDNRFMAFHLGVEGNPTEQLAYRLLATYQEGWGTYGKPYNKKHHNVSVMLEADYTFRRNFLRDWNIRGSYGMDFGKILGNNAGFQLTISKRGIL